MIIFNVERAQIVEVAPGGPGYDLGHIQGLAEFTRRVRGNSLARAQSQRSEYMSGRRSNTGITDFLSDLVDDIKDFVDDEVLDRGRDTERDLRRTARNWSDSDDDRGRRSGSRGSRNAGGRDVDDLKRTIRALARKIDALDVDAGSDADSDLPIAGYDDLTAVEVNNRLGSLSQADLATVDQYERAHADRSTVTGRIEALSGPQPWSGYDEQTVVEIRKALTTADDVTMAEVRKYEAGHKNRRGVLDVVEAG